MEKWEQEVTAASEIKKVSRKIVVLPTYGWKVPIRALSPFDFAKFKEIPLREDELDVGEGVEEIPEEVLEKIKGKREEGDEEQGFDATKMIPPEVLKGRIRKNLEWAEECIVAAVIPTPQLVVVKTGEPCPPNGVYASDFREDWEFLVTEILELSGMGIDKPNPFREEAKPDDRGSNSEEVRGSTQ